MDAGERREKFTAMEMLMMERGSPFREARTPNLDVSPEHELDSDCNSGQYSRPTSLHVEYTAEEVERMAKEISEGTVSQVHLSLLGYWICESIQHYELAKGFIRELSLDQGYNVNRIENEFLRALLISTKAARPVEARHKVIALPLSLRVQRARTIKELEKTSLASSPTKDYPPNTPDRPAPLSIRSRHSGKSSITPSTGYRSVSAPTTQNNRSVTAPLPRKTHILEDTASNPLLVSPIPLSAEFSDRTDADDVFGIPEHEGPRRDEPVSPVHVFDESRLRALHQLQGTAEVSYQYQQRIYELSHSGLSSRTSDEAADGFRMLSIDKEAAEITVTQLSRVSRDGKLDTTPGHQKGPVRGSTLSDTDSSHHANTHASSTAASDPFEYDQGTSRRRDTGLPRFKLRGRKPNVSTDPYFRSLPLRNYKNGGADQLLSPSHRSLLLRNFQGETRQTPSSSPRPLALRGDESKEQLQSSGSPRRQQTHTYQSEEAPSTPPPSLRPLPLRMYGSRTHLSSSPEPTSPSRIPRPKGAGNMVREKRPTRLAVPSFHTALRSTGDIPDHSPRRNSPLSRSQLVRRSQPSQLPARTSSVEIPTPAVGEAVDRDSISDMLEDFPTPPTQSSISSLSIRNSHKTPAGDTKPIGLLAQACRSSTTTPAAVRKILEETRAYGETLSVMDWTSMSAPERSWRENNEMLLVGIYGRKDTELSDEDVAYVDSIARKLATKEAPWLLRIFKDESGIF